MPLSSPDYHVANLTKAINLLPNTPTMLSSLKLFTPQYLTTTYVQVERKNTVLQLAQNRPRGAVGDVVRSYRTPPKTFSMMHFVKDDVVRADDVQNIRAFGSVSKTQTVAALVNDKLAQMKADIDYTREHAMLGALKGKILDADGQTLITDIYDAFKLKRIVHEWRLSSPDTNVAILCDNYKLQLAKLKQGESTSGIIALCSPAFMQTLITHPNVENLYMRYQAAQLYREGNTEVDFVHKGIRFIVYADEFESGLKIDDDEAIILPTGTRGTFFEYFAPADMNQTVNTLAQTYYASSEKLSHDKGWSLHAQSNPLPLVLRPDLVQTIRLT